MRNRMVMSRTGGAMQSPCATRRLASVITPICMLEASCAFLFGAVVQAFAADTITWTPYAGNPNVNATFQAYPGGLSADNTIILTITCADILQGTQAGQHLSITGANAAQFQEDTNVIPSCAATLGEGNGAAPPYTCALAIYFNARATPGTYTATLTYNFVDGTSPGSQSITLSGTVLPIPTPSGNASLAFLPVMTTFAGTGSVGYSGNNGPAIDAELNDPSDVAVDGLGNVYIADSGNYVVRKVDTTGKITVYAGTPQEGG
jgi:NHL repeat